MGPYQGYLHAKIGEDTCWYKNPRAENPQRAKMAAGSIFLKNPPKHPKILKIQVFSNPKCS